MVDKKVNKTHEPDIMYASDSVSGSANVPLLARQSILLLVLLSVGNSSVQFRPATINSTFENDNISQEHMKIFQMSLNVTFNSRANINVSLLVRRV